jgi:hypothetical protein
MAKNLCKTGVRDSILIGSAKNIIELTNDDLRKITSLLSLSQFEVSRVALNTRKCFLKNLGHDGTVLSSNENIITASEDTGECVIYIEKFLYVRCQGKDEIVIKGMLRPFHQDESGKIDVTFWNGFQKVKLHPTAETLFVSAKQVKRKVMLYKCEDTNIATVVDYMRQLRSIPYEIMVPVYPEKDDMLLIQGENTGDIWHGKVLSVDLQNNEVDVFFFIEKQHPNRFVRETFTRLARNTVSLDAVIGLASGQWINANSWYKSV